MQNRPHAARRALATLLCGGLLSSLNVHARDAPPKNIVLILADDLGWTDTTLLGDA